MSDMPPPPPPPPEEDHGSSIPPPPDPSSHAPQAMTGWATLGTGGKASSSHRLERGLGARLLDIVIMFAVFIILVLIFGISVSGSDGDGGLAVGALFVGALLFGLVGIAYEVTMIALKGQTVGKMATSVKVVRADNGLLPGWGKSIGRWAIPTLTANSSLRRLASVTALLRSADMGQSPTGVA